MVKINSVFFAKRGEYFYSENRVASIKLKNTVRNRDIERVVPSSDLGSSVLVGQFAFIYVLILCAFEQRDSYNQLPRNETKVFVSLFVVLFYWGVGVICEE